VRSHVQELQLRVATDAQATALIVALLHAAGSPAKTPQVSADDATLGCSPACTYESLKIMAQVRETKPTCW